MTSRPTAGTVRFRQLRGLLRHWRRCWGHHRRPPPRHYQRELIPSFGNARRERGICCWCGRPCGPRAHYWHDGCARAFAAAKGLQRQPGYGPLPGRPYRCAGCGVERASPYDFDVDHRVALSVAWASRNWRTVIRAYTLQNLQYLCQPCHRTKTAADRIALTAARKSRRPLIDLDALIPHRRDPTPERGRDYERNLI